MSIRMVIVWYDRNKESFEPIYETMHCETFVGETPAECMEKYYAFDEKHDLNKYTRTYISGIY